MSESQFAYGSFTLDELRSLAASPQVGTMQAMPQSFRALADRVGEVADLLSHAQADLPNWWKGPAAKQAAASLGRAVAEAREFHDSAMGAATAVSRCAQVVAEQQNQMMNVPDVQEPGVSAVVQHPTTPFEALEAARQDAAYQAAHEQAVQVVNGIAAQYVETRSQLSNIGHKFGENFVPAEEIANPSRVKESPHNKYPQAIADPNNRTQAGDAPLSGNYLSLAEGKSRHAPLDKFSEPTKSSTPGLVLHSSLTSHELNGVKTFEPAASDPFPVGPIFHEDPESIHRTPNKTNNPLKSAEELVSTIPTGQHTPTGRYELDTTENEARDEEGRSGRAHKGDSSSRAEPFDRPTRALREGKPSNMAETASPGATASNDLPLTPAEATHQPLPGDGSFDNPAIIPPYSNLGSVHRTREERNPRPAYLKERKSVWLPETFAAPPDGVLDPDWFVQY